jgi:hypothetical protein
MVADITVGSTGYILGLVVSVFVEGGGIFLSYFLAIRHASEEATAKAKHQTEIDRALALVELQRAFDVAYDNDLNRWQTMHDLLLWLKASNEQWKDAVDRALQHMDDHYPQRPILIDPDLNKELRQ